MGDAGKARILAVAAINGDRAKSVSASLARGSTMRRQKRDKSERAFQRGYRAGLEGRNREICPHDQPDLRDRWLSGWRQGRQDDWDGHARLSAAHLLT